MSSDTVKNIGHSVNARLKKLAQNQGVTPDYVFLRYAIERFLYRLGISRHANRFVLKGASAFSVWVGPMFRVTRDADLYSRGESTPGSLLECFREICNQEGVADDGVRFDMKTIVASEIKKDQKYNGTRIAFHAYIAQARVSLQFDIGFGDAVYPSPKYEEYPTFLDGAKPKIKIYPKYSMIAEKFEAMVSLGMQNSRLKDFFDIWFLSETFDFDYDIFKTAVEKTLQRRACPFPKTIPLALTPEFTENGLKTAQWNAFLRRAEPNVTPKSLTAAGERIIKLVRPVLFPKVPSPKKWLAGRGWS